MDSTFAIDFLFGEGVVLTVDVLLVGTLNRLDQLLEIEVLEFLLNPINGSHLPPFEEGLRLPKWLFEELICLLLPCLTSGIGANVEYRCSRKGSFSSWSSDADVCSVCSSGSGHWGVKFLMKPLSPLLFDDVKPPLSTSKGMIRS